VGGWTETRPVSLGLLPSGPDPVGEWCVHRQPPSIYLDRSGEFRNRLERLIQAARASPARGPRGLRRGIKTKLSCFPPPGGSGERLIPRQGLRESRRPIRRHCAWDAWSLGGSAILAEAHRERPYPSPRANRFPPRTSADERPERARH